jgi:predicted RNA-binding Zn-ribbon protein involved in translation (DUF1610 family)
VSLTGWLSNLVSYEKNKEAGCCPSCGGTNIKIDEFISGRRRSISFFCNDCGSGDHFDGMAGSGTSYEQLCTVIQD